MSGGRTVVITGIGLVTPLATDARGTFDALCEGKNAIAVLPEFRDAGFPVHIGARVPFAAELLEKYPEAKRHGSRKLAFALSAVDEALEAAGLKDLDGERCAAYFGVETSRIDFSKAYEIFRRSSGSGFRVDMKKYGESCLGLLTRDETLSKYPFFVANFIASRYKISGPLATTSNACASSNFAIGAALRKLREGAADIALVGSADEMIDAYLLTGFHLLGALSQNNSDPAGASRPFDRARDGFVLGEAGAALVLETLDHALARGAGIFCELSGFGSTSDGGKITACHPEGGWLREAMARAIADSGIAPDDVKYVNAHATSTKLNDASETRAIKSLFGDHAKNLLVSATKSMIGHTVAAAGAVEAAVTAMSVKSGVCHPTRNLAEPDEGFDLNYCASGPVRAEITAALSNSCGFSGGNSCLAFKKYA